MRTEQFDRLRMENIEYMNKPSPPEELPYWLTNFFCWSLNDEVKKYVEEKREKKQTNQ